MLRQWGVPGNLFGARGIGSGHLTNGVIASHFSMMRTARIVACLQVLALTGACGHGPPERFASIADYDTPPTKDVTVALRSFDVSRPARGLSAFPDGGIAIPVDQGVEVNVCEKQSGKFRQVAVIHEASKPNAGFATPFILDWLDTAVRISRYTGGDTVVRLPLGVHVGVGIKDVTQRNSLPECEQSLNDLRNSTRMPDGSTTTP